MTDPDQYDGFATPEELNLSKEEIEELRNNKKQISEYAREKIRALMNEPFIASTKDDKLRFYAKGKEVLTIAKEGILKYNEALKKLAGT
jgi:hypothetical protein